MELPNDDEPSKRQESSLQNPFGNLEGNLSEEQLQTWQQMNENVQSLVQMPEEDTEDLSYLVDESLLVTDSELQVVVYTGAQEETSELPQETSGLPQEICGNTQGTSSGNQGSSSTPTPSTSNSADDFFSTFSVDRNLTLQYLSGKISFLEFSEAMEKGRGSQEEKTTAEEDSKTEAEVPMEVDETVKASPVKPKGKERKKRRRICELPKHLEPHMGEVNMTFAKGDHEQAVKQCMEVIRQAPQASKPFQTLSMIYEDIGDMQKSLQFSLIAAYLDPRDEEEWVRLADMSLDQNDFNQAIKCYTNALKFASNLEKKLDFLWARSRLYEETKEYKRALEGYQSILSLLPETDSEKYFKLAWSLTRSFYELGEKTQALQTITKAFQEHPNQITAEDVNLLLELQIPAKHYIESIEVLVKHCGVSFKFPGDVEWSSDKPLADTELRNMKQAPVSCQVPDLLAIDLRVKLAVCLLNKKYAKLVKKIIEPLFEENIEELGDLYLDVAEAYMENGYYKQAEPILGKLVKSKSYDLAAVWLRYGDCLKALREVNAAVKAYNRVVDLAPSHVGARLSLSALQQQLGKHDEALEALEHRDIEERKMSKEELQMLLQKCHLLHSQGKIDEFLDSAKQLLFQEWKDVEADEMSYVQAIRTFKHKKEILLTFFEAKGKDISKLEASLNLRKSRKEGLPYTDVWELYKKICNALIESKRYKDFEDISMFGMMCPIFQQTEESVKEIELIILIASLLARNTTRAYTFARHLVLENINNFQVWNMFLQVIQMCNESRHNRFCLRRMLHEPDCIPLGIMNGHNSMATGSYKHSLGEYGNVFRRRPTDPMLSLCIGLDFIHIASQRFAAKRQNLVTQGLAFLNNYLELRGECQETYYNIARALHQINITFAAIHYYNKALSMPPCIGEKNGMYDLSRDIAYNLALIYQASGSKEYARYLIQKYCVI